MLIFTWDGKVPSAILRYMVERDSPVRASTVFRRMILSVLDMVRISIRWSFLAPPECKICLPNLRMQGQFAVGEDCRTRDYKDKAKDRDGYGRLETNTDANVIVPWAAENFPSYAVGCFWAEILRARGGISRQA